MENWNALKQLIEDTQKDADKAFVAGRGASAKRVRKATLQMRELINKIREDALNVYRKTDVEIAVAAAETALETVVEEVKKAKRAKKVA